MKLTVLGNNGPYPAAGGACSGYLLQEGNRNLLFDCGNGVLSNLQKIIRFEELDLIVLSHLHSDHMSDMMVLRYAIQIKYNRGLIDRPLKVYAPPNPAEEFERLNIKDVFILEKISGDLHIELDNLKLAFREMTHPVQCFAASIDNGQKRFVYSGDTSWNDAIMDFSKNADLLMLDAGLLSKDKKDVNVPHLTAFECGIIAREAGVEKLLLTHFWPDYVKEDLLHEAKANFDKVELTEIMNTYKV